jgi:serine/threonine protein kinase
MSMSMSMNKPERETATKTCRCKVCVGFPLRHHLRFSMFGDEDCMWDFDDHLNEFMNGMQRASSDREEAGVDQDTADRTAKSAQYRVEKLRQEWAEVQVEQNLNNNNPKESSDDASLALSLRRKVIAPVEWNEVMTGGLLGNGGFSTVKEVIGFETKNEVNEDENFLRSRSSCSTLSSDDNDSDLVSSQPKPYTKWEESSRNFLKRHVFLAQVENHQASDSKKSLQTYAMPRYAVKHLKVSLTKDPDRFRKAAIDLALEAELLMNLNHPNIVKIRACCREGAEAFKGGKHTSFFFVMDLLPETLDGRIWEWRKSLKKYKSRCNFVWGKEKYTEKIRKLLLARLGAARDIVAGLEHMHSKRIINRDVKTANVGFNVHGEVKIYDLGLSRILPADADQDDTYRMSCVGTKSYMAPEIRNKEYYSMSVDVYSFGIVLWEIMSLSTPMESFYKPKKSSGSVQAKKYCVWLPLCECWPTAIQNLIRQATSYEPLRRPRMSQARSTLAQQLHDLGMKDSGEMTRRNSTFSMAFVQSELEKEVVRSSLESRTTAVDWYDNSSHRSIDGEENESGNIVVAPKQEQPVQPF